ncbi:MAG TPA: 7-carboxy-7-deazaguanine synthase QueE [Gammaproteobacteria bacterium]
MGAAAASSRAQAAAEPRLKITEVFLSIQGEAQLVGWPTVFIRLTGCPLRCRYCDTAYAFTGGEWRTIASLVDQVRGFGTPYVCVTGGEPLAQARCLELLRALCDAGFSVSLETSGALDVTAVDPRVARVVDVKTPASGEAHRNLWSNFAALRAHDAVKIVICDRADYEWARALLAKELAGLPCPVLFSPSYGELAPGTLADWILEDRLPVRLQVQLHKVLWGDVPGR